MNSWIKRHVTYGERLAGDSNFTVHSLDELDYRHMRELYAVTAEHDAVIGNQRAEGDKIALLIKGRINRFAMANPKNGTIEQIDDLEPGAVLHIPRDTLYAIHVDADSVLVFSNAFWMKFSVNEKEAILDLSGNIISGT